MSNIEKTFVGWLMIHQPIMMPKDELVGAEIKAFQSEEEPEKDCYVVRVHKATPTIEFVCKDEKEAEELCRWFKASTKVVKVDFSKDRKQV